MKTSQLANLIRIGLLTMVLVLVIALITVPLWAKEISLIIGQPLEPEKMDIRPIPVPVAPLVYVRDESISSATPAPLASAAVPVVEAVPVPIPAMATESTNSQLAQHSNMGSSNVFT